MAYCGLGGSTILENNIVQTGASAGSSIASGVIFTIPALVILGTGPTSGTRGVRDRGLGGILAFLLGAAAALADRRAELKFPEGVAAA